MTSQSDISLLLTFRAEMIDPSLPTGLWWCATPEDAAAVGINAVCKNRYAAWEDLAACTEFITQFCYVFVATPNDADREEIVGQLQKWVPVTILVADKAAFRGNESVVELLDNAGPKAVESLLFGALDVPRPGLIDLSQVEMDAPISQNRMMSGLVPLDYCTGGFRGAPGEAVQTVCAAADRRAEESCRAARPQNGADGVRAVKRSCSGD